MKTCLPYQMIEKKKRKKKRKERVHFQLFYSSEYLVSPKMVIIYIIQDISNLIQVYFSIQYFNVYILRGNIVYLLHYKSCALYP